MREKGRITQYGGRIFFFFLVFHPMDYFTYYFFSFLISQTPFLMDSFSYILLLSFLFTFLP